jgi:hypothetical protein
MAPSSIPNAGFGVFTTLPIAAGSPIQPYPDAPSIPVLDPDAHCKRSLSKYSLRNWAQIEYFWSGDGHIGFEALQSEDNVVTMGALSNYHPFLYNVKPKDAGYDDSYGNTLVRHDQNTSPQLGAFSYYPGQVFVAIQVRTYIIQYTLYLNTIDIIYDDSFITRYAYYRILKQEEKYLPIMGKAG